VRWATALALAAIAANAAASRAAISELQRVALTTLQIELALAVVSLAIAAIAARSPRATLGLDRPRGSRARLGLAALGTVGLSAVLDGWLVRSGLRDASVLGRVDTLLASASAADLALAGVGLVIAPAFAEELFCRGLLQRALARRVRPALAVLGTSLVFGALHLEWIQGAAAALLGLYLGSVALRFDSTRAAIACHLANNAVAVLTAPAAVPIDGSHPAIGAIGALLAAAGFSALPRARADLEAPGNETGASRPVVSPLQFERRSDDS
jgi:membrane protease YdiL (CAAX protease family)